MTLRSETLPATSRTAPRKVRREQLIKATIESVAKHGLSGATVAQVTLGANLSQGIANYHFASKQALFSETLRYLADEYRSLWRKNLARAGSSPEAQLLARIDADFHPSICNRKKMSVWFAFFGEARYRSAYKKTCEEIDFERIRETCRLCQRLIDEAGYTHVDPEIFARSLEAFIDGLWLNMLLYHRNFSRSEAKAQCLAYLAATFPEHFESPLKQHQEAAE